MDLHGSISHKSELGLGLRLDIAIVEKGFINSVDDELAITFGGEALFDEKKGKGKGKGKKGKDNGENALARMEMTFPVAVQWNFIFKRKFALFPEVGIELPFDDLFDPGFYFAVGGRYHFKSRMALMARITHNRVFQLGVTF